jgi:hypothetical protein
LTLIADDVYRFPKYATRDDHDLSVGLEFIMRKFIGLTATIVLVGGSPGGSLAQLVLTGPKLDAVDLVYNEIPLSAPLRQAAQLRCTSGAAQRAT